VGLSGRSGFDSDEHSDNETKEKHCYGVPNNCEDQSQAVPLAQLPRKRSMFSRHKKLLAPGNTGCFFSSAIFMVTYVNTAI